MAPASQNGDLEPISTDFPPIRACLFDMDGLLINTEDLYTLCSNIVLNKHGRPNLPWSIKAQLMGIPGSSNGDVFHNWAQLPISREQYKQEQSEQHKIHFPECRPLPGVEKLLKDLRSSKTTQGLQVEIALASSSEKKNYELKTSRPTTKAVLEIIPEEHRVLGDDPRIQYGRGKPAPDIYLLALQSINSSLPEGVPKIEPKECLVFEDSVLGIEAGRRAGMRAVWVPHPNLAAEYQGKEKYVLAGRSALLPIGNDEQLGAIDDGWAEQLTSLENFPYEKFGIVAP
ncbi:HAD-like protein [Annulohypoxylon maeteangense]|uniref:HAD-like protein n=1 Tax=Annulohypoxylon maeteangense TaxID=1927788 RepID=UPI002007F509|nr:HAD-like protein [Annulohypoxylon maeteangense]KAI0884415.1 HAD-like protein [Annulohypoxylon maeteangense]